MNVNDQEALTVPGHALGYSKNGAELRRQRSCTRRGEADQGDSHWPEEDFNSRYNHLDDSEASEKRQWSHHLLERPKSVNKKDQRPSGKESGTVESICLLNFYISFSYSLIKLKRYP